MSQQPPQQPTEFIDSVEANWILQIALRGRPRETAKLQKLVQEGFDKVLEAIQTSPEMLAVVWETITKSTDELAGKLPYEKDFTAQEIVKIRKAVLNLLKPGNDYKEKESSEQHASPELAKLGAAIQGLYTNWTYFSNTLLLATSIHAFCEEWVKKSLEESDKSDSDEGTLKTKTFSQDDEDYDEDFWDDNDEICPGDIAIIKVIPDILQAYLYYLNRYPQSGLVQVLKDEQESGRWQNMRSVVADMKRLFVHTKLARKMKNAINYSFDIDAREVINELDSYSLFLPKE